MEAIVRPFTWEGFASDFKLAFQMMRTPGLGWLMISLANGFVNQMLPNAVVRKLSAAEMAYYGGPYQTIGSRKPVRQWPLEVPIDGQPADVHEIISSYSCWLQETGLPKLLFYALPGGIIQADTLAWVQETFPNLTSVDVGEGIHFIQEDNPHLIGEKLAEWVVGLGSPAEGAAAD
jgi:haloalkane dehalogenase